MTFDKVSTSSFSRSKSSSLYWPSAPGITLYILALLSSFYDYRVASNTSVIYILSNIVLLEIVSYACSDSLSIGFEDSIGLPTKEWTSNTFRAALSNLLKDLRASFVFRIELPGN